MKHRPAVARLLAQQKELAAREKALAQAVILAPVTQDDWSNAAEVLLMGVLKRNPHLKSGPVQEITRQKLRLAAQALASAKAAIKLKAMPGVVNAALRHLVDAFRPGGTQ